MAKKKQKPERPVPLGRARFRCISCDGEEDLELSEILKQLPSPLCKIPPCVRKGSGEGSEMELIGLGTDRLTALTVNAHGERKTLADILDVMKDAELTAVFSEILEMLFQTGRLEKPGSDDGQKKKRPARR